MASPRATYLASIVECLQRIKLVDDYNTDAGYLVTREPAPNIGEAEAEFIAVTWAKQQRATDPAVTRTHRLTTVEILAKVPAKSGEGQGLLDHIVGDIEKALADQQFRYPVGYEFPKYQSAEPMAAHPAAGWIGVVVTVTGHIPIR